MSAAPAAGSRLSCVAVVLAGGTGTRFGARVPKQLLRVAGKPIIEHTLSVFEACEAIDSIIVLMAPGFVPAVEAIVAGGGLGKVTAVLEGGATRNETTRRALDALGEQECNVVIHDAVRPLVTTALVERCVAALQDHEAVDVTIPSADTIVVVEDDRVVSIPDRTSLRRGQTPQCFRLSTIRRAYEIAWQDPSFTATDDCSVVLRYLPEVPIHAVAGSDYNIKVTEPLDLDIADKLFQIRSGVSDRHLDGQPQLERLTGKVAVVLGGSHGIGRSVATQLEALGVVVHAFSRSSTGTHVQDPQQVAAALAAAAAASGRVDLVVLTAGMLRMGTLTDADPADVEEMIAVNYAAPVHVARAAAPYLTETGGHLLMFASSSYTRGRAGYSLYSSSKAAVVNLTQALAEEWAETGARVNCISPARTATPMRLTAFGDEPAHELLTAAEVASAAVLVLASDLTGQIVDVRHQPGEPKPDVAIAPPPAG